MKTLVLKPGRAPAVTSLVVSEPTLTRTPGARAAKFRKFRSFWGRSRICSAVMLVAIWEDWMSTASSPMTVTFSA